MKQRGAKPEGAYSGKSEVLSTRIRPDTRKQLVAAAHASGRSLSQEVEHRLRRTFADDVEVTKIFGSPRNYGLMRVIAAIIDTVDLGTAGDWFARPESYDKVAEAVIAVLEALRPAPAPQGKRKMAGIQTSKKYSEMPPEMPPHQIDRKAPSPEIYEALHALLVKVVESEDALPLAPGAPESL